MRDLLGLNQYLKRAFIFVGGEIVLKKSWLKTFAMGVIAYFIVSIALNLAGSNTVVNRLVVLALILLVGSVIIYFHNNKSREKAQ